MAAYLDMLATADYLGLTLAPVKCTPPTKAFDWLGYTFCTQEITVTIPAKKLNEIVQECEGWKTGANASRRDLQRLVGRLQYVTRCVNPAR